MDKEKLMGRILEMLKGADREQLEMVYGLLLGLTRK